MGCAGLAMGFACHFLGWQLARFANGLGWRLVSLVMG
jgi:hypothetical protein